MDAFGSEQLGHLLPAGVCFGAEVELHRRGSCRGIVKAYDGGYCEGAAFFVKDEWIVK